MPFIKIWVYDNVFASGINGPIDVFATANAISAGKTRLKGPRAPMLRWSVESPDGKPVRTASGQIVHVDGLLRSKSFADAILLTAPYASAIQFLDEKSQILQLLLTGIRDLHEQGALLATYCNGSFLLAEAGLLEGRIATTHWACAADFTKRFPNVDLRPEEVITEDGRILCSGAVTSYLNLALRLVAKLAGEELADLTARMLLIDPNRASQASYAVMDDGRNKLAEADPLVGRAQRWMRSQLQSNIRVADLASHLGTTERTLNRRFKAALGEAPLHHLQRLRIEAAKRLLVSGALSLGTICERVGYEDVSTFRQLFKRETGLSPREYKLRFARQ